MTYISHPSPGPIEKNVPMPDDPRGRPARYPWADMAVGDSFFVAGGKRNVINGAATKAGKKSGKTFVLRTVDGGVRVWRTA